MTISVREQYGFLFLFGWCWHASHGLRGHGDTAHTHIDSSAGAAYSRRPCNMNERARAHPYVLSRTQIHRELEQRVCQHMEPGTKGCADG